MSAAPALVVHCQDLPDQDYYNTTGVREFIQFDNCPDGQYNEMASLAFVTTEDTIKHLFSRDSIISRLA